MEFEVLIESRRPHKPPQLRDLTRHKRRCSICHRPDRQQIDAAFLRWRSPREVVENFHLSHHSLLYRHAHATGLFVRRERMLGHSLERILEQADNSILTVGTIIRACRAQSRLWREYLQPDPLTANPSELEHDPTH